MLEDHKCDGLEDCKREGMFCNWFVLVGQFSVFVWGIFCGVFWFGVYMRGWG